MLLKCARNLITDALVIDLWQGSTMCNTMRRCRVNVHERVCVCMHECVSVCVCVYIYIFIYTNCFCV
jgi:hypothetical protein